MADPFADAADYFGDDAAPTPPGDLLGRPRAYADIAARRRPGRLRPRPGVGRRRRRRRAVVRVPVRTPTLSADVDAMTLLLTASESARFRLVERSWVAAGASRRPRGAHLARRRLVAPVLSLAALYF